MNRHLISSQKQETIDVFIREHNLEKQWGINPGTVFESAFKSAFRS